MFAHVTTRVGRLVVAALLAVAWLPAARAQNAGGVLRIGTGGKLVPDAANGKEDAARANLIDFIKTETGLTSEVARQADWRQLADRLAGGQLNIGVFQGHEFAWARQGHPTLRPLALAVNVHVYPTVHIVTGKDGAATDFAGLKGHSLAIAADGRDYLRLFVDSQARAAGQPADAFFSKIVKADNVEDALDDAVDGTVQAAAVDRAALEAFKRRKPGRFRRLKEVAHSPPLVPGVIAYAEGGLEAATLARLRDGLLNANRKDRGQTLLTLFKLTGFGTPPADFDQVLAREREAFPVPGADK
jgi:ABC-type phosphate/phosphonate transport system substrate-binding protein